jgi:hypothetical protein
MNLIRLHNSAHLGDNILQINYMRRALKMQPDDNSYYDIGFEYATKPEYIPQLLPMVEDCGNWLKIIPLEDKHAESIETWIGYEGYYYNHPEHWVYDKFYVAWFKHLSEKLGILNPIRNNQDVLFKHPSIKKNIEYDILFINCVPLSGQFDYERWEWEKTIIDVAKHCSVMTVQPVAGIISAVDMAMDVLEIGSLACGARRVVGVCTGPLHTCLNTVAIDTVQKWDIFTHNKKYEYNDRIEMHFSGAYLETIRDQVRRGEILPAKAK